MHLPTTTLLIGTALFSVYGLACSTSGSSIVVKTIDTSEESIDEQEGEGGEGGEEDTDDPDDTESSIPLQPSYLYWTGERTIIFPDICTFNIVETGQRITEPDNELVARIESECPACQVYQIENSPDNVECGELGTLPTGGTRYRVLAFQEQYSDGTINVLDGPTEVWHAISPDWQLDYIAEATSTVIENNRTATQTTWVYQANNSFQAFTFSENSSFTLSE